MRAPDWKRILSEYLCDRASQKRKVSNIYLGSIRSLLQLLEAGSHTYLDESLLLKWMCEKLSQCALERVIIWLTMIKDFAGYLEKRNLCTPGLLKRLKEDPNLLVQLKGSGRFRTRVYALDEQWRQVLESLEASLRGFAPIEIARTLRISSEFIELLQKKGVTAPDTATFLEWLDGRLSRCKTNTVASVLPYLDKFFKFLVERGDCALNPFRIWRQGLPNIYNALILRREGKALPVPPPRFQSFLAPAIEAFIAHKRSLGRKFKNTDNVLAHLDRYIQAGQVCSLSDLTKGFLLNFWCTTSHWQSSTRKISLDLLQQFFRYLERRGEITSRQNPAESLPRIIRPPRSPYIYSLREIVAIFTYFRIHYKAHHEFERQALFTLFHLLYACGLRISEAIRLEIQDVNLNDRTLFIRNTKFGKSRLIPFGRRAGEYLMSYQALRLERFGKPKESAPFFVHSIGTIYSREHLEEVFREARQFAGVGQNLKPEPRIHDIRHTFAVHRLYKWYIEGAVPQDKLVLLSIYMGHVDPKSTQHYLHISEDLQRIAARPLERGLEKWMKERQVFHFDE